MTATRISRARIPVNAHAPRVYCSPGSSRILRVFDTAPLDGSLIEVPYFRYSCDLIRLIREPAGDVWVEHVDPTIDPKPSAASNFKGHTFVGAVLPGSISAGTLSSDAANYCYYDGVLFKYVKRKGQISGWFEVRDRGVPEADGSATCLNEIIRLVKRLAELQNIERALK